MGIHHWRNRTRAYQFRLQSRAGRRLANTIRLRHAHRRRSPPRRLFLRRVSSSGPLGADALPHERSRVCSCRYRLRMGHVRNLAILPLAILGRTTRCLSAARFRYDIASDRQRSVRRDFYRASDRKSWPSMVDAGVDDGVYRRVDFGRYDACQTNLLGSVVCRYSHHADRYGRLLSSRYVVSRISSPAFELTINLITANIMISNIMPPRHQGVGASLVNTVLNYSISIGLGLAGLVETRVNPDGTKLLEGYRAAWYLGIGIGGLGMLVAMAAVVSERREQKAVIAKVDGGERGKV